jgi:hypothetical protein
LIEGVSTGRMPAFQVADAFVKRMKSAKHDWLVSTRHNTRRNTKRANKLANFSFKKKQVLLKALGGLHNVMNETGKVLLSVMQPYIDELSWIALFDDHSSVGARGQSGTFQLRVCCDTFDMSLTFAQSLFVCIPRI